MERQESGHVRDISETFISLNESFGNSQASTSYIAAAQNRLAIGCAGSIQVDNFYEPSYESSRAVRWKIELALGDSFGIACLWDRWTDPVSGELVVSFSMLTVNADEHPVMRQFHKPGDEKRTPVIIAPALHDAWLSADPVKAAELMSWSHMPELRTMPSPRS